MISNRFWLLFVVFVTLSSVSINSSWARTLSSTRASQKNKVNIVSYGNLSTTMSGELLLIIDEMSRQPELNLSIESTEKGIAHRKNDKYVLTKTKKAKNFLQKLWQQEKKQGQKASVVFESSRSLMVMSKSTPQKVLDIIRGKAKGQYSRLSGRGNQFIRFWNDLTETHAQAGQLQPSTVRFFDFNRSEWKNEKEWHFSFYITYNLKMGETEFSATIVPKEFGGLWRLRSKLESLDVTNPIYVGIGGITPSPDGKAGEGRAFKTLESFGEHYVAASLAEVIGFKNVISSYKSQWSGNPPIHFLSTNLVEKTKDGEVPLFEPFKIIERSGKKIALIGITAPKVLPHALKSATKQPWLKNIDIKPAKDFFETEEFLKLRTEVDFIVVITSLRNDELGESYEEFEGVDLIVRRQHRFYSPAGSKTFSIKNYKSRLPRFPLMVIPSKDTYLNITEIDFSGRSVSGRSSMHILDQSVSSDGDDQADYDDFARIFSTQDIVLPDHRQLYENRIVVSKEEFANLAAELMRKSLDGEVGIFNIQNQNSDMPGELDSSIIRSWVRSEENLMVVYLLGSDLQEIFLKNKTSEDPFRLAISGIEKNGFIAGAPIQLGEVYRVITSTAIGNNLQAYPAIGKASQKTSEFLKVGSEYQEYNGGQKVSLTEFLIEVLRKKWKKYSALPESERNKFYKDLYDGVFHLQQTGYWVHHFKRIGLEFFNLKTTDLSAFSEVVDSRLNAADQRFLGANLDYAAIYRKKPYISELGIKGQYSKIEFNPETANEVENVLVDDLVYFANIGLPVFQWDDLPAITKKSGPIYEFAYDTEFEKDKGVEIEKNVQSFLGWRFYDGSWVQSITLAVLNENRLTRGNRKSAWGYNARFEIAKSFHGGLMTWRSDFDYRYFFNNSKDSAEDLESRLIWDNYLDLKIFGKLSLGPYFKWAVFEGQTFNDQATQTTMGLNFNFSSLWKPKYQKSPF